MIWEGLLTLLQVALILYTFVLPILAAVVAVRQESKLWKPASLPSLTIWGSFKVFSFNLLWMWACMVGVAIMVLKMLVTAGSRADLERDLQLYVERPVARLCLHLFIGRVQVQGREHLPSTPVVYVANHASQLDVAVSYLLNRRYKWIAKQSVTFLPGVGQVMWLGGHIMINRTTGRNQASKSNLFQQAQYNLEKANVSVFVFPQGTRNMVEQLPFKSGAFVMAQTSKRAIVPLSLQIPPTAWNSWHPFGGKEAPIIQLTVHPSIPVTGEEDRNELKETCEKVIYSVLPPVPKGNKKVH